MKEAGLYVHVYTDFIVFKKFYYKYIRFTGVVSIYVYKFLETPMKNPPHNTQIIVGYIFNYSSALIMSNNDRLIFLFLIHIENFSLWLIILLPLHYISEHSDRYSFCYNIWSLLSRTSTYLTKNHPKGTTVCNIYHMRDHNTQKTVWLVYQTMI